MDYEFAPVMKFPYLPRFLFDDVRQSNTDICQETDSETETVLSVHLSVSGDSRSMSTRQKGFSMECRHS